MALRKSFSNKRRMGTPLGYPMRKGKNKVNWALSPTSTTPMNAKQARLILLEQAVEQAQNTIEFMHGCLTEKGFRYDHPRQTTDFLAELANLVPRQEGCGHSVTKPDCESCQRGEKWRKDRFNARRQLGLE